MTRSTRVSSPYLPIRSIEADVSARTRLVERLAQLVGPALQLQALQDGWPALASIEAEGERIPIALFASLVGRSHRDRDHVERRFQNPANGTPMRDVPGRTSVLLGLWEEDPYVPLTSPLVVTAEAARRSDGRTTRWSVFAPLSTLKEAEATGWATHVSDSGERIMCLRPALLPVSVTADIFGVQPDEAMVRAAVGASGLLDAPDAVPDAEAAERARRAATALVRDARFSRRVLTAYGQRCAMCGLGLSLVQGAHIYPASAPGSKDEPSNGLALCANHHLAFDRHILAVDTRMMILFHPDVIAALRFDEPTRRLTENTFVRLRAAESGPSPDPVMFLMRYEYFGDKYEWLRKS